MSEGNVCVVCRFRPLNEKEISMSTEICAEFAPDNATVRMLPTNSEPLNFNFDFAFPPSASQVDVYENAAKSVVEAVMEGFNGTVLAYGQTSSGKTFTMTGPSIDDPELMGIIPRMVNTVFENIENNGDNIEYSVQVSYSEIYLEKIRDLLDTRKQDLKVHEDKARGVYIANLTEKYVGDDSEIFELMRVGASNREVGYTHMNAGSSRSHSIFGISISQVNTRDCSSKKGTLYLVDLAGSEKVGKTGAEGKRLEEAKNINKSLTALGLVIYSLTDGKSKHVPYRDSKLTRILQNALGGNSKTTLIITCSPSSYNEDETISTLRFGTRAKAIKNKATVNKEYTVAELRLMLARANEEIARKEARIKELEGGEIPTGEARIKELEGGEIIPGESSEPQVEMDAVIVELEETRTRLQEEVDGHTHTKIELEETKERARKAEMTVDFQAQQIERLEKEINEMKPSFPSDLDFASNAETMNSLELALEEAQETIASLEGALQEDKKWLNSKCKVLEMSVSKLSQNYANLLNDYKKASADLAAAQEMINRSKEQNVELRRENDAVRNQLFEQQTKNRELEDFLSGEKKFNLRKVIKGGGRAGQRFDFKSGQFLDIYNRMDS